MTRFRFLPLAFLALLCLASCDKEVRCRVPIGDATCQLDPNSPLYPGLNTCDGYEYLIGGYNGIVVIRTGWETFVAYERSCPNDTARLEILPEYGNLVLVSIMDNAALPGQSNLIREQSENSPVLNDAFNGT